jgi:hypothetical protein
MIVKTTRFNPCWLGVGELEAGCFYRVESMGPWLPTLLSELGEEIGFGDSRDPVAFVLQAEVFELVEERFSYLCVRSVLGEKAGFLILGHFDEMGDYSSHCRLFRAFT